MPDYGQTTGTDNGVEGSWFIELDDTAAPISEYAFIPVETMPDIVPVWSIALLIGNHAGILQSTRERMAAAITRPARDLLGPAIPCSIISWSTMPAGPAPG